MKKIKSILLLALVAMGFAASAQTIVVNNTTGVFYSATFHTTGCLPQGAGIPPGVSTVTLCAAPSGSDWIELFFTDGSCTPPGSGAVYPSCGVPFTYTPCVGPVLVFTYDCANGLLLIN